MIAALRVLRYLMESPRRHGVAVAVAPVVVFAEHAVIADLGVLRYLMESPLRHVVVVAVAVAVVVAVVAVVYFTLSRYAKIKSVATEQAPVTLEWNNISGKMYKSNHYDTHD